MDYLDLYDFRLRIAEMYRERNRALEAGEEPDGVLTRFRRRRDDIFATHPQSALDEEQKERFTHLPYFPYDAAACIEGVLVPAPAGERRVVETSGDEGMPMSHAGDVRFTLSGHELSLAVYWIDVYGGGLFLPFRDATAPSATYGGGRYLFDTVKGSDFQLVAREDAGWRVLLDFNYAYNPSCAYNHRWACPLAPLENRLPVAIRAGEQTFRQ